MADKLTKKQSEKYKSLTEDQAILFDELTRLQKSICLESLMGKNDFHSYVDGGGTAKGENSIAAAASRLLSDVKVKAFLESVRAEEVDGKIMGREEMLQRLTVMARTPALPKFRTIITKGEEGEDVKQTVWDIPDSENLTDDQLSCIMEVSAGKEGLKIKQHSQREVMKDIANLQGYNKQEEKHSITINIDGKAAQL